MLPPSFRDGGFEELPFVGFALVRTTIKDSQIDEDWMQISFFKITERRLPENAGALHKDQVGVL